MNENTYTPNNLSAKNDVSNGLNYLVTNICDAVKKINAYSDSVKEIKILDERIWIVGTNHYVIINQTGVN
jgi:hypothetical protein